MSEPDYKKKKKLKDNKEERRKKYKSSLGCSILGYSMAQELDDKVHQRTWQVFYDGEQVTPDKKRWH